MVHHPLTAKRPAISSNIAGRGSPDRRRPAVGRQPGQRLGQRLQHVERRPAQARQGRHGAALARPRAERPGLGDEQAVGVDQRHRPEHARGRCARSRCRGLAALRHRRLAGGLGHVRRARGDGPPAQDRRGDGCDAREPRGRPEPAPRRGERGRQPRLRVAVHHAAPAGRKHGRRADRRRAAAKSWSSNGPAMSIERTIVLRHSDKPDFGEPGPRHPELPRRGDDLAGRPLGLGAVEAGQRQARHAAATAWPLNFQNTVRAISSRLDLQSGAEDYPERIDHDNAGVASAALFDSRGIYMFVALETSRQVAVVDAYGGWEIFRFDAGRAPQGLALSAGRQPPVRQQLHGPHGRRVRPLDAARRGHRGRAAGRDLDRRAQRKADAAGAAGQAALLRRQGHAPRARRLHQLRVLPQRRRPGRPHLGPDRLRRGPAQHRRACAAGPGPRASCTGATTSTRSRTSRARSAPSRAARAS